MGRPSKYSSGELKAAIDRITEACEKHGIGKWVEIKGLNWQTLKKTTRAANNAAIRHLIAAGTIEKHPIMRSTFRMVNEEIKQTEQKYRDEQKKREEYAKDFLQKLNSQYGGFGETVVSGDMILIPYENIKSFEELLESMDIYISM